MTLVSLDSERAKKAGRVVTIAWEPDTEWHEDGQRGLGVWGIYSDGWFGPYARARDVPTALKHAADLLEGRKR